MNSFSLLSKWRRTVCTETPARSAIAARVISSKSSSSKATEVASRIASLVASVERARACIRYWRFEVEPFAGCLALIAQRYPPGAAGSAVRLPVAPGGRDRDFPGSLEPPQDQHRVGDLLEPSPCLPAAADPPALVDQDHLTGADRG